MRIERYDGDRKALRPLFELADDSAEALDGYIDEGEVLVARDGDEVVGHLQLVQTDAPGAVEIKNMAVVPHRQRSGAGRALVEHACTTASEAGATRVVVATGAADVGNLRFYQRLGFRMLAIDRDAFTPASGYPEGIEADGIPLLDRVWFDRAIGPSPTTTVDDTLSDRDLISWAAEQLSIPRTEVPSHLVSFVLHAPLELLARAALLPAVAPLDRAGARARITTLVDGYLRAAPAWDAPDQTDGDVGRADVGRAELVRALAPRVLPALAAAGHGNIYLGLLARPTLAQPRSTMLPAIVHSLDTDDARPIPLVPTSAATDDDAATRHLVDVLDRAEGFGPPPSTFIAPLVEHGLAHGISERLLIDGTFVAPARPPTALLRFAAFAMLQGDEAQAPYGWTHCFTLAQGALRVGELADCVPPATYVAMVYLLAHWGAYGSGTVDVTQVPPVPALPLFEALRSSPGDAAAAAWHAADHEDTIRVLASAAATNHDAHRVKYTLACIDAAAADPEATSLHLAAAAYLNAWWEVRGDPADPWR